MTRTVQLWILRRIFAAVWSAADVGHWLVCRYGIAWSAVAEFADNKMAPAIDALADHWDFTPEEVASM